jgi:hypothetical protein
MDRTGMKDGTSMAPEDGWFLLSEKPRKIRARWAPEPAAEIEVTAGKWQPTIPDGRIVWTEADLQADPRRNNTPPGTEIPAPIAARIGRFPSHQWALGVLLHHQPLVHDLADANPVLAYCLANHYLFHRVREERILPQALQHAGLKQRELLQWLGFPGTEAAVRLFRKLIPEEVDPFILIRLRASIVGSEDTMALFAHHPRVTGEMLELGTRANLRALVTHQLLAEIAKSTDRRATPRVGDTILMTLNVLEKLRQPPPAPFTSVAGLNRCHERADQEYDNRRALAEQLRLARRLQTASRGKKPISLPAPPIPGTDNIVPLATPEDLINEGYEMRHCAGALIQSVNSGRIYCYRVLSPERATLAITPAAGGQWRVFDLKGRRNAEVKAETRLAVHAWLGRRMSA